MKSGTLITNGAKLVARLPCVQAHHNWGIMNTSHLREYHFHLQQVRRDQTYYTHGIVNFHYANSRLNVTQFIHHRDRQSFPCIKTHNTIFPSSKRYHIHIYANSLYIVGKLLSFFKDVIACKVLTPCNIHLARCTEYRGVVLRGRWGIGLAHALRARRSKLIWFHYTSDSHHA